MPRMFRRWFSVMLLLTSAMTFAQKPNLAGDYSGMLGPYHIKLHLIAAHDGTLSGTVDSPDQGLSGVPCSDLHLNGQAFSFTVPIVHGTWVGVVSGDGSSLTGIWSQGSAMPLNFTRGTASATVTNPGEMSGAAGTAAAKPASPAASGPQCPATSSANYWDGSSWKPMTYAVTQRAERGFSIRESMKNPFNNQRGVTNIIRFKDVAAPVTLGPSPRFCFPTSVNISPQFTIGTVDVKKDYREIEVTRSDRNPDSWIPSKRTLEVDIKRVSDTAVEVTPKAPLEAGQYVLSSSPLGGATAAPGSTYDFGVEKNK